jgi:hypothetical protein
LAKRQLDPPEDYANLQAARLTKALRCADVSLEEGDLKAIAPFVKVPGELYTASILARRGLRSRIRPAWWRRNCSRTKKVAQKRT